MMRDEFCDRPTRCSTVENARRAYLPSRSGNSSDDDWTTKKKKPIINSKRVCKIRLGRDTDLRFRNVLGSWFAVENRRRFAPRFKFKIEVRSKDDDDDDEDDGDVHGRSAAIGVNEPRNRSGNREPSSGRKSIRRGNDGREKKSWRSHMRATSRVVRRPHYGDSSGAPMGKPKVRKSLFVSRSSADETTTTNPCVGSPRVSRDPLTRPGPRRRWTWSEIRSVDHGFEYVPGGLNETPAAQAKERVRTPTVVVTFADEITSLSFKTNCFWGR